VILKNKIAIITGASQGMGREIALAYAGEGANIALVARTKSNLDLVANEVRGLGAKALTIPTDVTIEEQVNNMVQKTLDEFGRIDILVNSTGGIFHDYQTMVSDLSLADWQFSLNINLTGVFLCSRAVLKHMIHQKSGAVINMSSGLGKRGFPRAGAYCASKFAVEGLTQTLALENKPFNIRVNALDPGGVVATPGSLSHGVEGIKVVLEPGVVRPLSIYLASDESADVTGNSFNALRWNSERQIQIANH